jgi:hypothetical protein
LARLQLLLCLLDETLVDRLGILQITETLVGTLAVLVVRARAVDSGFRFRYLNRSHAEPGLSGRQSVPHLLDFGLGLGSQRALLLVLRLDFRHRQLREHLARLHAVADIDQDILDLPSHTRKQPGLFLRLDLARQIQSGAAVFPRAPHGSLRVGRPR